jgi:hypothetical protein
MSWAEIRRSIRERQRRSAHSHREPPPPITGWCATVAFIHTLGQAITFAILLCQIALRFKGHGDIVCLIFMGISYFFGSGTLVATFYNRTWWVKETGSWISSFNFLTMVLSLMLSEAMRIFWFTGS